MHARLRGHIEITQLAQQSGRRFGRDRHRLIAAPARNVVEVRNEPLVALARSNPHRIRVEAQLVVAGDRRPELVELRLDWLVGARHHADTFQLAQLRIRAADRERRSARAHFRLALEAQHRKRGAFGRGVEYSELHRPGVAALVARVIACHLCRWPRRVRCHRLAQRVIRGAEISRHLHVRHVERVADFVEAMRLPILRQRIAHLQPRRLEQVAQRVLVFVTIEPTPRRAALLRHTGLFGGDERRRQRFRECLQLRRFRARLFLRRHLAQHHAVMHQHPSGKVGGVRGLEFERCQIQAAFLHLGIVALEAMLFDKLPACGRKIGRRQRGHGREKQTESGENFHAVETLSVCH